MTELGVGAAIAAAIFAAAGLGFQFYWRRPILSMRLSGYAAHEGRVVFHLAIHNESERIVRGIRAVALIDGKEIPGSETRPFSLAPMDRTSINLRLPRPVPVDVGPGGLKLAGEVLSARVTYGFRARIVPYGEV